jgi:hypothetical protein
MHDPFAYAVRMMPFAPQWLMGLCGQNSAVIQSVVHETALYAKRQSDLSFAAYRGALRATNPFELAHVEFGFMAHSLRLACDAAGHVAQIAANVNDEDVNSLPIE